MSDGFRAFAIVAGLVIGAVTGAITTVQLCRGSQDQPQLPIIYGLFAAALSTAIFFMVGMGASL